ncbi:hypothetical protein [Psychromonas sp. SP041]|uniref:hypothetical protein n=1 Tax=Psychromonas sp. SP041 TaxID=1365007 RepID=UPI0010C7AD0A|nr:hypothetical protein [Psychromonas sp. SP041]
MKKNNKKTIKEITAEIKKANESLQKQLEGHESDFKVDETSYEQFRDGLRFMTGLFVLLMTVSFLINIASTIVLSTKSDVEIYTTSRNGDVEKVINIRKK